MRPYGNQKSLEKRRRKAIELLEEGLTVPQVAKRLSTSTESVYRWRKAHAEGGDDALCAKPVPGRPAKLDPEEFEHLWDIMLEGAMNYGFPNDLWTLKRIAQVIRKEFGVRYHPGHVWKILRGTGWSCQVPERRAIQRDEKAIAHWKRYKWPSIKKTAKTRRPPRLHR
jgi:transposase